MKPRKLIAFLLAILMALTTAGVPSLASGVNPGSSPYRALDLAQQSGKLMITEPGSYVLTGKLTGTVYVDPKAGEVELILDGVDINGKDAAGVIAVSGELKITLPEGSVSRITDMSSNHQQYAAVYSLVPTTFAGEGSLYVTGSSRDAIRVDGNDICFNGGAYAVKAPETGINARSIQLNSGHFSIKAQNSFAPDAQITRADAVIEEVQSSTATVSRDSDSQNQSSGKASAVVIPEDAANRAGNAQRTESSVQPDSASAAQPDNASPVQRSDSASAAQPGNASSAQSDSTSAVQRDESASSSQVNDRADNRTQPSTEALPEQNAQAETNRSGNTPPMSGASQPGMGMQPGQSIQLASASDPTEIVAGTMTNSAATLEADYDSATYITVTEDDSQVKITSSGTYVVSGSSSNGNITVKKGTSGVVLVLEDLDLTSTTGATVSVNKEAEVKIIISGNVVLTDNENPEDEDSEDAEVADAFDGAALKAKANSNVYVTGDGTLTINGNAKNGIKGGDDASLIFDGVTVNINAVNDGINVNYDVTLLSGNFTIAAADDAIHADHILTIGSEDGEGPTIRVTGSNEGLEGTVINVNGGDISIVSTDDAVNAANGDGVYEGVLDYSFNMMGGKLVIRSQGDGIDSNGNVNLIGGSAEIQSSAVGGEAGIDYDGQLYLSANYQLNNHSGTAGPDVMGGLPGNMSGMPGQMGNQSMSGQLPTQTDGQSASGQIPNQMNGQNFNGPIPTQANGQNTSGQMPAQANEQNISAQVPSQANEQNISAQVPSQANEQSISAQVPSQANEQNTSSQTPGQAKGQSFNGPVPAQMNEQNTSAQIPAQANGQNTSGPAPAPMNEQNMSNQTPRQMDDQGFNAQMPIDGMPAQP